MIASELVALVRQAAQGCEDSAQRLLQEFGPAVLRTVRLRLGEKLRRELDSADLAQAVWQSFFFHLNERNNFESPRALCAYLITIAKRKVLMAARRDRRLKHGGNWRREQGSSLASTSRMVGRNATPSQEAVAAETWERLMATLSIRDQKILHLRISGHTRVEIAEKLEIANSTVRRVLDGLKADLAET